MQGHGSTCDCTFSVLLHIALCMCFAFFVCLHSALLHTPRFQWGPPFSVGDPIFPLSTVYGLPPSPRSRLFPSFFQWTGGPQQCLFCQKQFFFAGAPAIFHMAFFFCQLNDTVCRAGA